MVIFIKIMRLELILVLCKALGTKIKFFDTCQLNSAANRWQLSFLTWLVLFDTIAYPALLINPHKVTKNIMGRVVAFK